MTSFNPAITQRLNALSEGVLNGHYIFSRDFDENLLARRFSQPEKHPRNIRITTEYDSKHLEQYFNIREETYKTAIGANFYAGVDENDSKSHMVLAIAGDNCIGGIRITVSSPVKPMFLPTECENFQFSKVYDKLDFSSLTYCEATRLALLPEFRDGNVLHLLFEEATKYAIETLGVQVVFGRAGSIQTRTFQTHYRNMGYDLIIRKDIKPPSTGMDAPLVQIFGIDFTPDRFYTNLLNSYNNAPQEPKELEFA